MLKRGLDITIAGLLLMLLVPVILGLIFLVICMIGQPVFFKQQRPGLQEKLFANDKFNQFTIVSAK